MRTSLAEGAPVRGQSTRTARTRVPRASPRDSRRPRPACGLSRSMRPLACRLCAWSTSTRPGGPLAGRKPWSGRRWTWARSAAATGANISEAGTAPPGCATRPHDSGRLHPGTVALPETGSRRMSTWPRYRPLTTCRPASVGPGDTHGPGPRCSTGPSRLLISKDRRATGSCTPRCTECNTSCDTLWLPRANSRSDTPRRTPDAGRIGFGTTCGSLGSARYRQSAMLWIGTDGRLLTGSGCRAAGGVDQGYIWGYSGIEYSAEPRNEASEGL